MLPRLIESWDALPREGEFLLQEQLWFDLKETYSIESRPEMAKDVAAFANAIGGSLIIGAKEGATGPDYSKPLPVDCAAKLANSFEEAVRDLCRPSPSVHVRLIPAPSQSDKAILVVNVDAAVDQPIAARHKTDRDAWRFPQRVGRHTEYLLPEQLPLHMNSKARRAKLLLLRVLDGGGQIDLYTVPRGSAKPTTVEVPVQFVVTAVDDAGSGAVVLRDPTDRLDHQSASVPIDDVEAVWLQHTGRWAVRLAGRFELFFPVDGGAGQELTYLPPASFVVSPLGRLLEDLTKRVHDIGKTLRGTLAVQARVRVEPSEAAIAERAHRLWLMRTERGTAGSARSDWFLARRQLLAEMRDE